MSPEGISDGRVLALKEGEERARHRDHQAHRVRIGRLSIASLLTPKLADKVISLAGSQIHRGELVITHPCLQEAQGAVVDHPRTR